MDNDGWLKFMSCLSSTCCSYSLNPQVLFYDVYDNNFYNMALNIFWSHHIQAFILKSCDSVHNQTKNNGKNLKLNNIYGNARMNWIEETWNPQFHACPYEYCPFWNMGRFQKSICFHHPGLFQEDTPSTPLSTQPRHKFPSLTCGCSNSQMLESGWDRIYRKGKNFT